MAKPIKKIDGHLVSKYKLEDFVIGGYYCIYYHSIELNDQQARIFAKYLSPDNYGNNVTDQNRFKAHYLSLDDKRGNTTRWTLSLSTPWFGERYCRPMTEDEIDWLEASIALGKPTKFISSEEKLVNSIKQEIGLK